MTKTSDAVFDILKRYTDTVFFVPGGGAAHLVDSLGRSGLKRVSALHEQGAGFMACGYAQNTGKLGVCLVTSGPGATNAITPCWAAWVDSIPVLFISGQANSWTLIGDSGLRIKGVQEVDIISLVKPITKACTRLPVYKYPNYPDAVINSTANICISDRPGPCWLDIPLDVQAEEI